MQLWRVFLQHDETGRESEATVEAEDYGHAARQAQRQHGPRWFAYAVKPEPEDDDAQTTGRGPRHPVRSRCRGLR